VVGQEPIGAGAVGREQQPVDPPVGVPAGPSPAHLHQPRPHVIGRCRDRDRVGRERSGVRQQFVAGQRLPPLEGGGTPGLPEAVEDGVAARRRDGGCDSLAQGASFSSVGVASSASLMRCMFFWSTAGRCSSRRRPVVVCGSPSRRCTPGQHVSPPSMPDPGYHQHRRVGQEVLSVRARWARFTSLLVGEPYQGCRQYRTAAMSLRTTGGRLGDEAARANGIRLIALDQPDLRRILVESLSEAFRSGSRGPAPRPPSGTRWGGTVNRSGRLGRRTWMRVEAQPD
jgi:hypothetical protein